VAVAKSLPGSSASWVQVENRGETYWAHQNDEQMIGKMMEQMMEHDG